VEQESKRARDFWSTWPVSMFFGHRLMAHWRRSRTVFADFTMQASKNLLARELPSWNKQHSEQFKHM